MNESKVHVIQERFSFDEDTSLKVFLRENTEAHIEIVARNLRKIDSLFIQYLISAQRRWQQHGLSFVISQVQRELAEQFQLLGIESEILHWQVTK